MTPAAFHASLRARSSGVFGTTLSQVEKELTNA